MAEQTQQTPELDLSSGFEPKPISATGETTPTAPELDLSSGFEPKPASQPEQNPIVSGLNKVGEVAGKALFGPDTALGNMHVTQGSPLEHIIKTFSPTFKGAGIPTTYDIDKRKGEITTHQGSPDASSFPVVDAAQFVDKDKHPVWKAVTEASQSLTTPQNVAIMIATGGLGIADSPVALGVANKLLSAGFSAQAVADAYKHFKGFKEAYDKGDGNDALYQLTHAVLSGALAYTAGTHAAGEPLEAASGVDKAVLKTASELPGQVADAAKNAVSKTASAIGKAPGAIAEFGSPKPTQESLVGKITQGTGEDIASASRALSKVDATKVKTFEDLRKVLDTEVRKNTAQVDDSLGKRTELYKAGDLEKTVPVEGGTPIVTNPVQDAIDQLHDYYQKTKNVQEEARMSGLQNKFETEGLTPLELNDIARMHSRDLNAFNLSGQIPATSLAKQAAENTRQGVKEQVRQIAPEIQDVDSHTSDLIRTRGLTEDMVEKVQTLQNKLQEAGYLRRGATATAKVMDTLTGGFLKSLVKTGQEGAGAKNVVEIQDALAKNIKKLNKLNAMSAEEASRNLGSAPFETENEAPAGWDKIEPSRGKLPEGFTTQDILRHELAHHAVGAAEGFNPTEIISSKHPELFSSPNVHARAKFDMSDVGKNGLTSVENVGNIDKFLRMYMAGPAADELYGGIPFETNPGAHGDVKRVTSTLKRLGYSDAEASAKMEQMFGEAKKYLSQSHVSDVLNKASETREPGLPDTHHFSTERIQQLLKEISEGKNARDEGRSTSSVRQHDQSNDSGGEGGSKGEAGSKDPGNGKKEVRVPQERTTGRADIDSAIKQAGAIPGGLQVGDPEIKVPDLAMFHDPKTGSTLAYPVDKLTPEIIAKELAKSRKLFGVQ